MTSGAAAVSHFSTRFEQNIEGFTPSLWRQTYIWFKRSPLGPTRHTGLCYIKSRTLSRCVFSPLQPLSCHFLLFFPPRLLLQCLRWIWFNMLGGNRRAGMCSFLQGLGWHSCSKTNRVRRSPLRCSVSKVCICTKSFSDVISSTRIRFNVNAHKSRLQLGEVIMFSSATCRMSSS